MQGSRSSVGICLVLLAVAIMGLSALTGGVSTWATTPSSEGHAGPLSASSASLAAGPLVQAAAASNFSLNAATNLGTFDVIPVAHANVASASLSVEITLKPSGNLAGYVDDISNPASPEYRQFLSPGEISSQFGASSPTYSALESYFEGYGLSVVPAFENLALEVTGTGAQVEAAFHTQFAAFREQYTSGGQWIPTFGNASGIRGSVTTGPVFYANTEAAELPSVLDSSIAGVLGLNGLYAQPTVAMPSGLYPGFDTHASLTIPKPANPLTIDRIQAIQGANYTWANLTPTYLCADYGLCNNYQILYPSTMHMLNGAENLWDGANTIGGVPDQGQGVTVAVVEVGCALPSDMAAFSKEAFGSASQLPDRFTQIAVNDPSAIVPNTNLSNCIQNGEIWGWTGETELDIEYIAAMAPKAHIDLIGDPSAAWITNPFDYLDIANYLTTGLTCNLAGMASAGMRIVEGSAQSACSISVTSNSYEIGEQWAYFLAAPEYIAVEDEDLLILNAEGVTNFFASGDDGSNGAAVPGASAASAGVPAQSPGATGVGAGDLTAAGPKGREFPSGPTAYDVVDQVNWTVVPAKSIGSFTYWSSGSPSPALGATGGGFGTSMAESQPWWENSLDTYSSGTLIDPEISGSGDFNMSLFAFGNWSLFWGGTSFACPIIAGEWVLIEEQADVAFGTPRMGDVNPTLFEAHNAQEAGVPFASVNPYATMENIGTGDSVYAPDNSYSWYYFNLSVNEPSDPILPQWFPSLANPAGPGWNFLQGLGMPNATVLDNELIGTNPSTEYGLLNQPYSILEVEGPNLVPFTELTGGVTYTLAVVPAHGAPGGSFTIEAYSGGENTGQYGGGTVTTIHTSPTGRFSYTPSYATPSLPTNASEYGYFVVHPKGGGVSFQDYAVAAPPVWGNLQLCVTDAYGICQHSTAEVTMFNTVATFPTGALNLYGSATVQLNGLAVANAMVTQTVYVSQTGEFNPYLPPSSYLPGTTIGHSFSDARGDALFWTAPEGLAELNGSVEAQVFSLQATYDGLTSNAVLVFVEPQSGSTQANVHLWGGTLSGDVLLSDVKYVDFLNVSVGSAPGEFENFTCPIPGAYLGVADGFTQPAGTVPFPGGVCQPFYDSAAPTSYEYPAGVWHPGIWESGIYNDLIPISLSVPWFHWGSHVVFSLLAGGTNDLSFATCSPVGCATTAAVQYPLYWSDPMVLTSPPSPTFLGLPGLEGYVLVGGLVAVAAAGLFVAGRRYRQQSNVDRAALPEDSPPPAPRQ